jgi:hypothetical protein
VARQFVCCSLAWMLALAFAPVVRAAAPPEVIRQELPDGGKTDIELRADSIPTWEEKNERVIALGGQVLIKQGIVTLRASRAIIWVAIADQKQNPETRGAIYAEGEVQLDVGGKKQTAPAAILMFSTRGKLAVKGKIEKKSIAESEFYQKAMQARQPDASQPLSVPTNGVVSNAIPPAIVQVQATAPPAAATLPPTLDPASRDVKAPSSPYGMIQPVQAKAPPADPAVPPKLDPVIEPPLIESPTLPLPNVNTRKLKIYSRTSRPFDLKYLNMPNGEQIALVTGGVKLLVLGQEKNGAVIDIEADQVVIWQTGGKTQDLVDAMRDINGATQGDERQIELYLAGNVVMRYASASDKRNPDGSLIEDRVIRADRVYYDLSRNKGIGLDADVEMMRIGIKEPAHFRAEEIQLRSLQEFFAPRSNVNASKLPGDPGLNLRSGEMTITEEKNQVRRSIFGFPVIDRETGAEDVASIRRFETSNTFVELDGIPIMYFPVMSGDVNDPVGPLRMLSYRQDRIFGYQFYTTWSMLSALGIKALPNERWNLMADYMSDRGPALGTSYDLWGPKLFGFDAPFMTHFLAYGVHDQGVDQLGGPRNDNWAPTGFRGRLDFRHVQEYDDFSFQGQVAYLSDQNFLEQYYKYEFDMGPNQETFAYLKYQHDNGALSVLAEPNLARPWVTESQWLPRLDGYWLGQSFFDRLTYNTWGSAGYANLQTYNLPVSQLPSTRPPIVLPYESPDRTGRFDWMQQISMPVDAGFLQIVPYANFDLAYYTQDNNGDSRGRVYGGGGVRTSVPFSRLYENVDSELLNLHGLYHKVTFNANYYNAWSDTPASLLPQLDRLNDDATQQSVRDIKPWLPVYIPGAAGEALFSSPMYDPRLYAIRRLIDTRADTLDTIQVLQADIRQRWQTKRGYEGMEHTVDYVTFDLSASFFPAQNRDNFGHPVSFVEYDATWAVGDRNGITSSGWFDPYDFGTRYWNVTGYYNRPDGTNLALTYRQLEPIGSRVLGGSVSYVFSPKYAMTLSASYDFGVATNQAYTLLFTRTGTDLTWSLGFSYNAIINNFSFNFMVLPNLLAQRAGVNLQSPFGNAGGAFGRQ